MWNKPPGLLSVAHACMMTTRMMRMTMIMMRMSANYSYRTAIIGCDPPLTIEPCGDASCNDPSLICLAASVTGSWRSRFNEAQDHNLRTRDWWSHGFQKWPGKRLDSFIYISLYITDDGKKQCSGRSANKGQIAHSSHRCFWKLSSSTRCIFQFFDYWKDSWKQNPKKLAAKSNQLLNICCIFVSCHCNIPWGVTSSCHFRINDCTRQGTSISHLGKRKIIDSKVPCWGICWFPGGYAILS